MELGCPRYVNPVRGEYRHTSNSSLWSRGRVIISIEFWNMSCHNGSSDVWPAWFPFSESIELGGSIYILTKLRWFLRASCAPSSDKYFAKIITF